MSPPLSGQHAPLHGHHPLGTSPWALGAGPLQITAPAVPPMVRGASGSYGTTPLALGRTRSGGSITATHHPASSSSLAAMGGGGGSVGPSSLLSRTSSGRGGGLAVSQACQVFQH